MGVYLTSNKVPFEGQKYFKSKQFDCYSFLRFKQKRNWFDSSANNEIFETVLVVKYCSDIITGRSFDERDSDQRQTNETRAL